MNDNVASVRTFYIVLFFFFFVQVPCVGLAGCEWTVLWAQPIAGLKVGLDLTQTLEALAKHLLGVCTKL